MADIEIDQTAPGIWVARVEATPKHPGFTVRAAGSIDDIFLSVLAKYREFIPVDAPIPLVGPSKPIDQSLLPKKRVPLSRKKAQEMRQAADGLL